jgi:hypothetical protein
MNQQWIAIGQLQILRQQRLRRCPLAMLKRQIQRLTQPWNGFLYGIGLAIYDKYGLVTFELRLGALQKHPLPLRAVLLDPLLLRQMSKLISLLCHGTCRIQHDRERKKEEVKTLHVAAKMKAHPRILDKRRAECQSGGIVRCSLELNKGLPRQALAHGT